MGTAEIPLVSRYANQELQHAPLSTNPIKLVGFGHAFRTEAGGSGQLIKGIYRVHQFSKVEIVVLCCPEASEALFADILATQQEILRDLELSYRAIEIPSEDLGAPAYRKVDMEAYMPGRAACSGVSPLDPAGKFEQLMWGEIFDLQLHGLQARRLGIRIGNAPKAAAGVVSDTSPSPSLGSSALHSSVFAAAGAKFVHTLNGTAAAIPRLMIAILEQHQDPATHNVCIPAALQPYLLGLKSIPELSLFPQRSVHYALNSSGAAGGDKKAS